VRQYRRGEGNGENEEKKKKKILGGGGGGGKSVICNVVKSHLGGVMLLGASSFRKEMYFPSFIRGYFWPHPTVLPFPLHFIAIPAWFRLRFYKVVSQVS